MEKALLRKLNGLLEKFHRLRKYRNIKLPLKSHDDFLRVPFAAKEELRAMDVFARPSDIFEVTATSGSTASRLLVYRSRKCHEAHIKRLVKTYRCMGMKTGDLCLNICSYELNSGGRIMEEAFKTLGAGVLPLGSTHSPEKLKETVDLIVRLKPGILNAYTNQLYDIFAVLGKKHSIKKCIVNGEPLFASYKRSIEERSGAKIYNNYGSMEFSGFAMAAKPQDEYLRLFDDGLHIEVLSDSGAASETGKGRIVVTDLENTCMPFIRYILGDVVEIVKRKGHRSIKVLGRTDASLLLRGEIFTRLEIVETVLGALGHPHFFILVDKDKMTYKDFLIVNLSPSDTKKQPQVLRLFDKKLHLAALVKFRPFTGKFPMTASGKFRHLIDVRHND